MPADDTLYGPRGMRPLFDLGSFVATPAALEAVARVGRIPLEFLARHHRGDWGNVDAHDRESNDRAIIEGGRIFSVYQLSDEKKIWIITEADRSSTCILLPNEY